MEQAAKKYYEARLVLCDRNIGKYVRLINVYSFLRLLAFLAGIFLIYQSLKLERIWATELVFLAVVIGFAYLVKRQSLLEKRKKYFSDLKKININETNIMQGVDNIYSTGAGYVDSNHPYSSDLDIFGKKSLFAWLNRSASARGNDKLACWLSRPESGDVIQQRQAAVKELAAKTEWMQDLQALLLFLNKTEDNTQTLFEYLKITPPGRAKALRIYILLAPWLFIASALISYFLSDFLFAVLLLILVNGLISRAYRSETDRAAGRIAKMSQTLGHFHEAIETIKKENWESAVCNELADQLKDTGKNRLSDQIKKLSILINRMDLGKMGLVGLLLSITSVWSVRQMLSMEDWKRKNNLNLEDAFDIIASFEALTSLGILHINNPGWCFPEITNDKNYTLNAQEIGHPLIPEPVRISNDFNLNNETKIDIITGSNMAGKSTFLRTLGINTVLALCGAPVCSKSLSLTPMLVFSYMRIADSLNESTSTFKAELDRLRFLLQILEKEPKVFFLIDEMLRGTNSVDKYRGSKAVIEKLIEKKAVGIVATHDLQIAQLEEQYPDYIRNFYFDIRVEGEEMQFDYKLKAGACKTFNASLLLRQLGIDTGNH